MVGKRTELSLTVKLLKDSHTEFGIFLNGNDRQQMTDRPEYATDNTVSYLRQSVYEDTPFRNCSATVQIYS